MLKTSLLRSQSVESDIVLWNSLASAANDAGRRAPISVGSQKMVEMCRIMAWRINKDPIRSYTLGIFWMTSHNLSIHSGSPKKNPVLFACGLKLERWPQAPRPTACCTGSRLARCPVDLASHGTIFPSQAEGTYTSVVHNTGTEVAERGG